MFRYFLQKHKILIIFFIIILFCSIAIALGIYAQITDTKITSDSNDKTNVSTDDYLDLKNNFNSIFVNAVNIENSSELSNTTNLKDIIYEAFYISENKTGEYSLTGKIPMLKPETENTKKINNEIYNTFVNKFISIMGNSSLYVICTVDYVGYINNDIASIIIRCTLKEGNSAQRVIIKTYNYDIKKDSIVSISDILTLKKLDSTIVQGKINDEIKKQIEKNSSINIEGYNVYKRNIDDNMYKVQNASTYFLGRNNYLYIIYAYGNNNFTSELDLVIF